MLETTYQRINEKLTPSPALVSETLQKLEERSVARRPVGLRHALTAVAALVLVLALSVGAMAAAIPGFRDMLFGTKDPRFAGLSEIVATGEANGMELEVLGAMGNEAGFTAYFTLRDTTGKGRVTASTFASVDVQLNGEYPPDDLLNNVYGGMSKRVTAVAFDEATSTMLYRCTFLTGAANADDWFRGIRTGETYNAENASVRLWLKRVINSTTESVPLDLSSFEINGETTPITQAYALSQDGKYDLTSLEEYLSCETGFDADFESLGGFSREEVLQCQVDENGNAVVLTPGEPVAVGGVDSPQITAVGFIDGKLHIQVLQGPAFGLICTDRGAGMPDWEELSRGLNGPMVSTEKELYKRLNSAFKTFSVGEDGTACWGKSGYAELVFDVSPEEVENYDFYLFSSTSSIETPAPIITVDFDLADSLPAEQREFGAVSIDEIRKSTKNTAGMTVSAEVTLDSVTANAVGVTVSGKRADLRGLESMTLLSPTAEYPLDRVLSHSESQFSAEDDDDLTLTLTSAGAPIPVKEIVAVQINGERVEIE